MVLLRWHERICMASFKDSNTPRSESIENGRMKGLKGVWLGIDYIDMGMGWWDWGLEMEEWEEKKTT